MPSSEFVFRDKDLYIKVSEGTGDNLLKEDIVNGYVDYYNYDIYQTLDSLENDEPCDGGMELLTDYYQDLFHSEDEVIRDVIRINDLPDSSEYELIDYQF